MKRVLILVLAIIILTACKNKKAGEQSTGLLSNFISISDNEDKGIKDILGFYGGQCEYSIGRSASTKNGKKKYFKLELSKSEGVQIQENIAELPASNIAYRFYKNLKEEKENYDEIRSVLIFESGEKVTFKYPTKQLELVKKRMKFVYKIVQLIKEKNFEGIKILMNDSEIYQYDKNMLMANLKKIEPRFGNVIEFRPYGFRINETKKEKEILHVSGVIIRDIENNEFSIEIDLNSEKEEIYSLDYKL